jgi:hypothetical protein
MKLSIHPEVCRLAVSETTPAAAKLSSLLRSHWRVLLFVAVLSLVTNFSYFHYHSDFFWPDSASYVGPAHSLLAGQGFRSVGGQPETTRTPGYPLLIALYLGLDSSLRSLIGFQHALNVTVTVAVAAFTLWLIGSGIMGCAVGLVLSFDLPTLVSGNSVLTETLFTVMLTLLLWGVWQQGLYPGRSRPVICWGLVGGASVLVRPVALLFCVPIGLYLFLVCGKYRWRCLGCFGLGFLLLPLAWSARNYHQTGSFILTSISGYDLLLYKAAGAVAIEDPGDFYRNVEMRQAELQAKACADVLTRTGRGCSTLSSVEVSSLFSRWGRQVLLDHPLGYAKVGLRGAATMMLGGDPEHLGEILGVSKNRAREMILALMSLEALMAIIGIWFWLHYERSLTYLILLTLGYFIAISAGAETYSRFRVPVMPVYALLIAGGVFYLANRISLLRRDEARSHNGSRHIQTR